MKKIKFKTKFSTYEKRNIFAILICLFLIASISVGYSTLTKNLDLNGEVTIRAIRDIRTMSIGKFTSSDGGYDVYNPIYNENSITINIVLPNKLSTVTYTGTIVNNGTSAMDINSIVNETYNNDDITYTLTGLKEGNVVSPGETITYKITFKYKPEASLINTSLGANIKFNFTEHVVEEGYATGNLLLNLRGIDEPLNNSWPDNSNNNNLNLLNVNYDEEDFCYLFSENGYGTLDKSIIPITGNFTLETYFKLGDNYTISTDETIISQVSESENDTGFFGIKIKEDSIITYLDKQTPKEISSYSFLKNPNVSDMYLIQLIRNNNIITLYINGEKIESNIEYDTSNAISSGIFKVGKWNNIDNNYFSGSIYAVRLYDRSLSDAELTNNYEIDKTYYIPKPVNKTIPEIGNISVNADEVTAGNLTVNWSRIDTSTANISNYYISLYNSNNQLVKTGITTNPNYVFNNLTSDTYYAIVYGVDEDGNTGETYCSESTISSTYCRKSENTIVSWKKTVTTNLNNLKSSGETTVTLGSTYTTTLSTTSNIYSLPKSITITMGGVSLKSGKGYTYSKKNGIVSIPTVTGDIIITASAKR